MNEDMVKIKKLAEKLGYDVQEYKEWDHETKEMTEHCWKFIFVRPTVSEKIAKRI